MPGHDTSSFVSRNRGVAGVTRWKKFCAAERFQGVPADSRPHLRLAASPPDFTRTELRSPRITTPMRRLTVDRKPLRTHGSLAQPPMPGNELCATARHLVQSDTLPHGRRVSRKKNHGLAMNPRRYRHFPLRLTSISRSTC